MSWRKSLGIRGLPGRDFHFQNKRNAWRCQPINVAGLTMRSADFHSKKRDQKTSEKRAASVNRLGLIWCSW